MSRVFQGGNTPLHVAAYNGNNESVELLLNSKSDPSVINEVCTLESGVKRFLVA